MGPNPIYSIFRIILGTSAFKDFADKIYEYIMEIAAVYDKSDAICGRYFKRSLRNFT